ncbi:S-layer homology domain-containing protein [Paenibacillus senegalensis]|uniref:S-layer homology domain-containing protein n=1 Tax=Paenibacillus senegalensis TaxID=1465766 RepID=UPI000289CA54|nr:S-layer homology domain-containing protein [Paenibacillus senegalensis]
MNIGSCRSMFFGVFILLGLGFVFGGVAQAGSDPSDHWAKEEIAAWIESGLMEGYPDGTFRPDRAITRAETASLIYRVLGFSKVGTDASQAAAFHDMAEGAWYFDVLSAAIAAGYMNGYEDGTIRPDQVVTRQEMAVMLMRIAQREADVEAAEVFTDPLPSWSKGAIGASTAAGWVQGYPDGTFRANGTLTRAEAVVMLGRFLESMAAPPGDITYTKQGIYGPSEGRLRVEGNVTVDAADVTLQNMIITGDLTLTAKLGEGEAVLRNLDIQGTVFVFGGGENSIWLHNSDAEILTVNKREDGSVRILATGQSTIFHTNVLSSVILEEEQLAGNGFRHVVLPEEAAAGTSIRLRGHFDTVTFQAAKTTLELQQGVIERLDIGGESPDTRVTLLTGAEVAVARINAAAAFTGQGTISQAEINVSRVSFERVPERVRCSSGIYLSLCGLSWQPNPSSGPSPAALIELVYEPRQISLDQPGEEQQVKLTAKWNDGTHTDATAEAEWRTQAAEVAEVSSTGRVRAVGEGRTEIEASYRGHTVKIPVEVKLESAPEPPLTVVELTPNPIQVQLNALGKEQQVALTAKWIDGTHTDAMAEAEWRTHAAEVAEVSSTGRVRAVGEGRTELEASYRGHTVKIPVEVSIILPADRINASISEPEPKAGEANSLTLVVRRSDGSLDADFTGLKKVTVSGFSAAPDSTIGYWNRSPIDDISSEFDILFSEGTATVEVILHHASVQELSLVVEGVTEPEALVSVHPQAADAVRAILQVQPSSGTAAAGIHSVRPVVALLDDYGNRAETENLTITAAIKESGPDGPVLEGTAQVQIINGLAVYEDLTVKGTGRGIVLVFTPDGLPAVESDAFDVHAPFAGSGTADAPYQVDSAELLNEVRYYLDAHFMQTADIDLTAYSSEEGWAPIGEARQASGGNVIVTPFTGVYDGGGFAVNHLTIKAERGWLGLFGYIDKAELRNIHLKDVRIEGWFYVGGLAGYVMDSSIANSSVSGFIRGTSIFGGLIGQGHTSHIDGSAAHVQLMAAQASNPVYTTIIGQIGGLAGGMEVGTITNSYAVGELQTDGEDYVGVGGLAGFLSGTESPWLGEIDQSYADFTLNIVNGTSVGGLIGINENGIVRDSYSLGILDVGASSTRDPNDRLGGVGGLVGKMEGGAIHRAYAAVGIQAAHMDEETGGMVGRAEEALFDSAYYDSEVSGLSDTGQGSPLPTEQLRQQITFTGWDFPRIWSMFDSCDYPYLSWQDGMPDSCFQVGLQEDGFKQEGVPFQLKITGASNASGSLNGYEQVKVYLDSDRSNPIFNNDIQFTNGNGTLTLTIREAGEHQLLLQIGEWETNRMVMVEVTAHPFSSGRGTKDDPYSIRTAEQLDRVRDYLSAHFVLDNDINLDVAPYNTGEGWNPIGMSLNFFSGSFDGKGYTISGLTIRETSSVVSNAGLFGHARGADIRNLHLKEVDITTNARSAGGLAGSIYYGSVMNVSVEGRVEILPFDEYGGVAGGAVGEMRGRMSYVHTDVEVLGGYHIGGAVGSLGEDISGTSLLDYSYSLGYTEASGNGAGGLVGKADRNTIVRNSYALGQVKGNGTVGGLIGFSYGEVSSCYAAGPVTFHGWVDRKGGIAGFAPNGGITDCYYDQNTTGKSDREGNAIPKTTEEMKRQSTFVGWDFDSVWQIDEGNGYPELQWPDF